MAGTRTAINTIVVFLLVIVIGLMVYYTVSNTQSLSQRWTGNTSVLADPDFANFQITLDDYPDSATETRVYWWNETGQAWNNLAAGTNGSANHRWTLNNDRTIWFNVTHNESGNTVIGMKGVNISYNNTAAVVKRDTVNPMAGTTFGLLPVIVFVMVAAIILGMVIMFGGSKKGGGGL